MKEKLNSRLIARYLSGEVSSKEEEKVKQWLQTEPNNRKLMEEFTQIWEASEEKDFDKFFSPEKGWEEINSHIIQKSSNAKNVLGSSIFHLNNSYSKKPKKWLTQFMRVAAIIVIASLLGLLAYQDLHQEQSKIVEPVFHEISMPAGQRGNILLSDGTRVTLNAESKIILPKVFKSDRREVTLIGEAFFEVTSNPDRPFVINTSEAVVQVLGTSFNVRSYPDNKVVQVVVKEGRVSFRSKKARAENKAILTAGEMGKLFKKDNRITKKQVNDLDLFLSWTKGYLKFKDTPMHKVAQRLERKYNVEVKFSSPDLKDLRLTAELKSRRLEYNADVISTSLNMKYKMDQQVITFYRNKE